MFTARIVTDSSDTSTILEAPGTILLMQAEPGAVLADSWIAIEIDDDGVVRVEAGEGDDDITEVYNSQRDKATA